MKTNVRKWQAMVGAALLAATTSHAADLVWIGGTGSWDAAANWSPAQVPTGADNAWITNNGNYTVTVPVPPALAAVAHSITVGGASGIQTLAVDRNALSVGSGGVINPNGHLDLLVSQTILTNAGFLAVNGTLNWLNGTIIGGGTTTIGSNGVANISGGVTLDASKLVNFGTATWSLGNLNGKNGAVITNMLGATFSNTFDGNMSAAGGTTPIFANNGLFQKTDGTAAAGTTAITFQFINTGTVEVRTNTLRYTINQQTAGLTLLDGGGLSAQTPQPLQFLGGSLVGTGLVTVANTVNVINSAMISPGLPLGEMDISGDYQQTSSGALDIDLGGYSPGINYDLVTVTAGGAGGVATLGGTLNVTLANGFSPTNGATFTFLTAVSRAGAFATFNYPSNDIGMQVSYDATSAKVTVSNLKPVVANPIADPAPIIYGQAFNFQFPLNTFTDPDADTLTYTASGMPAGITFTGATRTFSGAPTQTGVFLVAVAATDSGIPSLMVTNTFTITINPATLTGGFTAADKVYDGTANATVLTRSLTGVLAVDTNNVSLTGGTASFADANKATGKTVTLTGATLNGTAAANYNLTSVGTATAAITALGITGNFTAADKVYDGTANATVLTRSLTGVLAAGTNNVSLTGGTASFADANKATGKTVTLTGATLGGSAAANYNLTSVGTTTASITAAALSVTADNKTKAVGAPEPAFTATYSSFVNGETNTVLGGTLIFTRAPGETAGNYAITSSGLTSANYALTFIPGTLTITGTSAPVVLSISGAPPASVVLTWNSVSNTTYRVQFKSDLNATNWTDLVGDVLASGATASKTDLKTTTNRFYRVRVLP